MSGNIDFTVQVSCEKCGKVGDDRDIPTVQFPDGSYRTLRDDCFKKETQGDAKP